MLARDSREPGAPPERRREVPSLTGGSEAAKRRPPDGPLAARRGGLVKIRQKFRSALK